MKRRPGLAVRSCTPLTSLCLVWTRFAPLNPKPWTVNHEPHCFSAVEFLNRWQCSKYHSSPFVDLAQFLFRGNSNGIGRPTHSQWGDAVMYYNRHKVAVCTWIWNRLNYEAKTPLVETLMTSNVKHLTLDELKWIQRIYSHDRANINYWYQKQ